MNTNDKLTLSFLCWKSSAHPDIASDSRLKVVVFGELNDSKSDQGCLK